MGAGLDARASRGAPPANGPPGGAGFPRLVDARSFILRSLRSSAHDISGCSSRASSSSVHRSSSSTIAVGGEGRGWWRRPPGGGAGHLGAHPRGSATEARIFE